MRRCVECGATYDDKAAYCAVDGTALTSGDTQDLIGRVVGEKYRVIEQISEGGFARIYRARHVQMPRQVALKVLTVRGSNVDEQRQRFLLELRTIAALDHPDVVPIYDVGDDPAAGLFMALRLMEGEDLGDRLDRDGPLPIQDVWAVIIPVCRALSAAHQAGIIHRDIKPYNIFLERDETQLTGFRTRLIDFGIAVVTDSNDAEWTGDKQRMTAQGQVLGSADTMSPEAATGSIIDHRSDIFSVGVCLYSMLTGEQPYKGNTPREMLVRRVMGPPPAPSFRQGAGWIPAALDAFVLKMLSIDAADRPQTAQAVIDGLQVIRSEAESAWAENKLGDGAWTTAWDWDTMPTTGEQPAAPAPCLALLADDEPAILDLAQLILRNDGIDVLTAVGGEDALARIDPTLDVLVFDVMMPDIDGITCAREARTRGFTGPIFVFTTLQSNRLRTEIANMQGVHFVDKTRELHLLPTLIRRALDDRP